MKFYNTLTKRKEEFVPLVPGKVSMYVCGPTVYNFIHIGNARPMIVFDTARRYMEHRGYEVNYVSNFTDVDDKIIKKALEESVNAQEISERYIKECKQDMADMNVKPATTHPQATQEIDGMIEMISILMEKGYAYEVEGTVYFRTRKFAEYGKLSHKNLDDLRYLGEEIDIHAGGEDLIFPHHENEIAQSECCNGKIFARYWLHNGFLNIDNKKMSKSLGNFFTVREIKDRYDLQVLRFFMLSAHYRSPLNFSAELMEASKNGLDRIVNAVDNLNYLQENAAVAELTKQEAAALSEVKAFVERFDEAMDDDLNTADAISVIFELVKYANSNVTAQNSRAFIQAVKDEILELGDVLGLILEKKEEILEADIEKLIEERQAARKAKDFARADAIRGQLLDMGIVLLDTREGVKWKKA